MALVGTADGECRNQIWFLRHDWLVAKNCPEIRLKGERTVFLSGFTWRISSFLPKWDPKARGSATPRSRTAIRICAPVAISVPTVAIYDADHVQFLTALSHLAYLRCWKENSHKVKTFLHQSRESVDFSRAYTIFLLVHLLASRLGKKEKLSNFIVVVHLIHRSTWAKISCKTTRKTCLLYFCPAVVSMPS